MKKKTFIVITIVLYLILLINSKIYAYDLKIIIENNLDITKNVIKTINEENIAPGFYKEYEIVVENQSSKILGVKLIQILKIYSDTDLSKMNLEVHDMNGNIIYQGQCLDYDKIDFELGYIKRGKDIKLKFILSLDPSAGNEYQSTRFEVEFKYLIYETTDREELEEPNEHEENPKEHIDNSSDNNEQNKLPQTGIYNSTYYALYVYGFLLFVLIIIVLFKRERERDKEKENKEEKEE